MSLDIKREPTALASAVGVLLLSIAKVAVLLDMVDWDEKQLAGIGLVIDNALLVLGALFIRNRVTPTATPRLEEGTVLTTTDATGAKSGTTVVTPTP